MKSKIKMFLFTLILGMITASSGYAQSNPGFTISSDNGVALATSSPLTDKYEMDISNMGWTQAQAQQAADYLDEKSALISLEVDYPAQKLYLILNDDMIQTNGWNIHNWNDHLKSVL